MPDNRFFSISYQNRSQVAQDLSFEITRNSPILETPKDYTMAVSSFALPTTEIPIFEAQNPSGDWITLSYGGNDYQQEVVYPTDTNGSREIFNLDSVMATINKVFGDLYLLLEAAHPGIVPCSPWMRYQNHLFYLLVPAEFINGTVKIFWNYHLFQKYKAFDVDFFGFDNADHKDISFRLIDNGQNLYTYTFNSAVVYPKGTLPSSWFQLPQFAQANSISDIISIVLTSHSLPIRTLDLAIIGSAQDSPNQGTLPIILTYNLDLQQFTVPQDAGTIIYDASLYRKIEMMGENSLTSFGIRVYFQRRDGSMTPVKLSPGDTFSLTLIFERKKHL